MLVLINAHNNFLISRVLQRLVMKHRRSRDQRRVDTKERHQRFEEELAAIQDRLNNIEKNEYIDPDGTEEFSSLPIFQSTKAALAANKFVKMSNIQRQSLLYSLCGRDLYGSSETGTGKTLAFLIPLIECLKRNKWDAHSGLGALVIAPTRDLAAQTYNVLKNLLGDSDSLSAGLITGGLNFEEEQIGLQRLNIIIATVGRLKEHMETSPTFNADSLQMLVLDEADRLMGTGFLEDLKRIIRELPKTRQTLLFTATAHAVNKELSRLSLQRPVTVILTEARESATPDNLYQCYAVVELKEKLNTLFSFLKNHKSKKIIVFMQTVKLVRFVFEAFRHLKPGIPLLHLTGKQSSDLRFTVCRQFSDKDRGVIFTTDVAARGLDFPQVDWVVQMDCPTSVETYIHRVGRTARFYQGGRGLLFLTPSETAFIEKLAENKVTVNQIQIQQSELYDIKPDLVDVLAKFSDVKHLAIKAFTTYIRSVQRYNDNEVFKLDEVLKQKDEFARSFGLLATPVVVKGQRSKEDTGKTKPPAPSEPRELDTFFTVIEDDTEEKEKEPELKPGLIVFRTPDTEIPEEEYKGYREYLLHLLAEEKTKTPKTKDKQNAPEKEEAMTVEEAAEKLLFENF